MTYAEEKRNQLYRLLHAQEQNRADAEYNLVRAKRKVEAEQLAVHSADHAIAETLAELKRLGERV